LPRLKLSRKKGVKQADTGLTPSNEEAKTRLEKWLKQFGRVTLSRILNQFVTALRTTLFIAKLSGDRVFEIVENIGKFPQMRRIVPKMNQEKIRENIFETYRIIYRFYENKVEILSVYHSARLLNVQKILNN